MSKTIQRCKDTDYTTEQNDRFLFPCEVRNHAMDKVSQAFLQAKQGMKYFSKQKCDVTSQLMRSFAKRYKRKVKNNHSSQDKFVLHISEFLDIYNTGKTNKYQSNDLSNYKQEWQSRLGVAMLSILYLKYGLVESTPFKNHRWKGSLVLAFTPEKRVHVKAVTVIERGFFITRLLKTHRVRNEVVADVIYGKKVQLWCLEHKDREKRFYVRPKILTTNEVAWLINAVDKDQHYYNCRVIDEEPTNIYRWGVQATKKFRPGNVCPLSTFC
jgi:hypothetical protein